MVPHQRAADWVIFVLNHVCALQTARTLMQACANLSDITAAPHAFVIWQPACTKLPDTTVFTSVGLEFGGSRPGGGGGGGGGGGAPGERLPGWSRSQSAT